MFKLSKNLLPFILSLLIVSLGQPAKIGFLSPISALLGFALFFISLPSVLTSKRRFFVATMWFALIQLIQLSWMTSIEFQGYYILIVYLALSLALGFQFGLLTLCIPSQGKISIQTLLFCSALWTLMEWSRLFLLCGFSWNPIGLALTQLTYSLQLASIFGIFGLSFWVMLTNLVCLNIWRMKKMQIIGPIFALFPYIFGAIHFHTHLKNANQQTNSISAALLQTNWLPTEKMPHPGRMNEYISPFLQWQRILTSLKDAHNADFIVLPEVAVPLQAEMAIYPLETTKEILSSALDVTEMHFPPLESPFVEQHIINEQNILCASNLFWCQTLSNYFNSELVVGLLHVDKAEKKNYNSAFSFLPHSSFVQRYDKQVLLPLAEHLPFNFLKSLARPYGILDFFSRGSGPKILGDKISFSPSICYEETFPEMMRKGRKLGAQFFVNLTNDNYFPNSSLHKQHLFHARVRAVENGVALIRACNAGMSGSVDCLGRILDKNILFEGAGVLNCKINNYNYRTLYTFWGDLGIVSLALIFVLLFLKKFLPTKIRKA